MTQPSGRVCGFPSSFGFALRSSPTVCALDALHVVGQFLHQTITTRSPRVAARKVADLRFYERPNATGAGSFAAVKMNICFRLFVFVVALLQAVKVFGSTGIPWTQLWAATYLGSFVVVQLLDLASGINCSAPRPQIEAVADNRIQEREICLAFGSVYLTAMHCAFCFYAALITDFAYIPIKIALVIAGVLTSWVLILNLLLQLLEVLPGSNVHGTSFEVIRYMYVCLSSLMLGLVIHLHTKIYLMSLPLGLEVPNVVCELYVVFISLILQLFEFFQDWSFDRWGIHHVGFSIDFIILHLLTGLLYYALRYQPDGTYKPAWVDNLP